MRKPHPSDYNYATVDYKAPQGAISFQEISLPILTFQKKKEKSLTYPIPGV